jgi:hypothetical protein
MFRSHRYQFITGGFIAGFLILVSFAFRQQPASPPHHMAPKNLKILPKDIDHMVLINIMDQYSEALGYKCYNCHAPAASGNGMDFASDAKPRKNTARSMMKMVQKLNKKFFEVKGKFADNFVSAKYEVTCYTCHHGSEHPAMMAPEHAGHEGHEGPGAPPPPPPPPSPTQNN